jgi:hypothetical protein
MIKVVNPVDGHFINFIVPHVKTEGNLYHDHSMVCKISSKLLPYVLL